MNTDKSNFSPAGNFSEVPYSPSASSGINGSRILPSFTSLALKDVLKMNLGQFHLSIKMDGITAKKQFQDAVIIGEQMPDGKFWAFDIIGIGQEDYTCCSKRFRWSRLCEYASQGLPIVPSGFGKEFFELVAGCDKMEGIVGAHWDGYFGYDIFKWKRNETFDVRVKEKLRGAISIEYQNQDAGKVPIAGKSWDEVQVGQIVEISAVKRYISGKFREPKFLRIRMDKI